jgi:hypothetical protein
MFSVLVLFALFYFGELIQGNAGQLRHSTHAARADIDGAERPIIHDMAAMDIHDKTAARAALRKAHIIAMHRFTQADVTTTRHTMFLSYSFVHFTYDGDARIILRPALAFWQVASSRHPGFRGQGQAQPLRLDYLEGF